jgi:hypothetical protein
MYLVRQTDDGKQAAFEVDGLTLNAHGSARKREPRAWRFEPRFGDAGDRRPSNLCLPGFAAVADSVGDAMLLIEELKGN